MPDLKAATELTDQDVRHILWVTLRQLETLELVVSDLVALLLFATTTESAALSEDRYEQIVERLTSYLSEANAHLQRSTGR